MHIMISFLGPNKAYEACDANSLELLKSPRVDTILGHNMGHYMGRISLQLIRLRRQTKLASRGS